VVIAPSVYSPISIPLIFFNFLNQIFIAIQKNIGKWDETIYRYLIISRLDC